MPLEVRILGKCPLDLTWLQLLAVQHRPKALNKLVVHQDIGEHLIKLVSR